MLAFTPLPLGFYVNVGFVVARYCVFVCDAMSVTYFDQLFKCIFLAFVGYMSCLLQIIRKEPVDCSP